MVLHGMTCSDTTQRRDNLGAGFILRRTRLGRTKPQAGRTKPGDQWSMIEGNFGLPRSLLRNSLGQRW
ncbi:hypothetical protein, partial [Dactylosporangium fulvum]|uniref:hypothetical protein n=1 Tax=Dactylosporangium fulvum TaxID=53359 RepID=UPI0031D775CB